MKGIPGPWKAKVASARNPRVRLFAFVVVGCRLTSAVLVTSGNELSARPIGGENVRCVRAEYYVAAFQVQADDVPPDVQLR